VRLSANSLPNNHPSHQQPIYQGKLVDEPAWYVVHTYSRHEARVESALLLKGLEIFLPRIEVRSCRQDRKLLLNVPLFPGYLFVHTVIEPTVYYEIIKLRSVVRILGGTAAPCPVPRETVDSIKTIVSSNRPYYPAAHLNCGMKVCILEGPLAGTVGVIIKRRDKKRRLVVAVDLFQRSVAVELDDETVEPWS
jgi:transcriptional antiterminator NusG